MKEVKKVNDNKQLGITLVEVLASIILLAIILLMFTLIFSQFMSTSNKSEDVISATYVGQTEMEFLYEASKSMPLNNLENHLNANQYNKIAPDGQWDVFERQYNDQYRVKLQFAQTEEGLTRVIVKVYDSSNSQPKAQMENLFDWMVEDHES